MAKISRFGPGERPRNFWPGDFVLTHNNDLMGQFIAFGQGLRYVGAEQRLTYWNHGALIVDDTGGIIEALWDGVRQRHMVRYTPTEYHVVHLESIRDHDRDQSVAFAQSVIGS